MNVITHVIETAGGRPCEIIVGRDLARADRLVYGTPTNVAFLTQPSVASTTTALAESAGFDSDHVMVLPDGEAAKDLGTVQAVYQWLNALGFTRDDLIVGIGGGALTDLAGFAAATYLRGVEVVYLPTTLLGAVDASIGGKTGVNVGGKNLAGIFRHPARIVVDLDLLEKLPKKLKREGAAEAVKAGFISDAAIVAEYESRGIDAAMDVVVPAAIAVKVNTVVADFEEHGIRAVLNYGHTIGHAIEVAAGISHGDAVAIGMVAAGHISELMLGFGHAERQKMIIAGIGLPVRSPHVDLDQIHTLMGRDKKRDAMGLRMILLEDFGRPVVKHVDPNRIAAGLEAVGIV